jgi:hypothetical protein
MYQKLKPLPCNLLKRYRSFIPDVVGGSDKSTCSVSYNCKSLIAQVPRMFFITFRVLLTMFIKELIGYCMNENKSLKGCHNILSIKRRCFCVTDAAENKLVLRKVLNLVIYLEKRPGDYLISWAM